MVLVLTMSDEELSALRNAVDCRAVLEQAGWALDKRESTARAAKYRRGQAEIVIVTHEGKGWFDPLNDRRGDVIALAQYLWGGTIGHARRSLRPLAGIAPTLIPASRSKPRRTRPELRADWAAHRAIRTASPGWSYLEQARGLPPETLKRANGAGMLKEGSAGTVWAAHLDEKGDVCGWEMRGPTYRGFARDGTKTLFRVGATLPARLAVTEGFIDALSLATLENWNVDTLYVSTGGGFGQATAVQLTTIAAPGARLVAAVDRGKGGDILAARLQAVADAAGCGFSRLRPAEKDWNDQLRATADLHRASPLCLAG